MKGKQLWQEYLMKFDKDDIKDFLIEHFIAVKYSKERVDSFMKLRKMKKTLKKMFKVSDEIDQISDEMAKYPKQSKQYTKYFKKWLELHEKHMELSKTMAVEDE